MRTSEEVILEIREIIESYWLEVESRRPTHSAEEIIQQIYEVAVEE